MRPDLSTGRFDAVEDARMVTAAVEHALAAGVPRARVGEILQSEPNDELAPPILVGKLNAAVRAMTPRPPLSSSSPGVLGRDEPR